MCDLSIIIVTYNSAKEITPCLNSVFNANNKLDIEVILVDNASTDNTLEIITTHYPQVKILANQSNKGFPAANNQGISICESDLILLLNPDTILWDNSLENLVRFFSANGENSIVGMNVRNADGSRQNTAHALPSAKNILISVVTLGRINKGWVEVDNQLKQNARKAIPVGWVSGASLAFTRQLFKNVGGLDENLFWMEDVDYCYRAHLAGFKIYFLSDSVVTHDVGASARSNIGRVLFHQHVSKINFFEKHFGKIATLTLKALFFAQLIVKILIRATQLLSSKKRQESYARIHGYVSSLDYIIRGQIPNWE